MFFQVPNSPKEPPKKEQPNPSPLEEAAILKLAPFAPNPKIFFENVHVGEEVIRFLFIQNPNAFRNKLTITKLPPADRHVGFNWNEIEVESNGEIYLEISWAPKEEGSWRDVISIIDSRNVKRDIPIVFKSLPKKIKKRGAKVKATVVAKTIKLPIKKYSPKSMKKKRSSFIVPVENLRSPKTDNAYSLKKSPYKMSKPLQPSNKYYDECDKENSPFQHNTFRNTIECMNFSHHSKLSFTEKLNKLESSPLFSSPTNINFKCDNITTPLRRETYNINYMSAPKPFTDNIDEFNDSLECDKMFDDINFDSPIVSKTNPSNNTNEPDYLMRKLLSDSFMFSTKKNSPNSFKFMLNNTTILEEIDNSSFKPNNCSTEQKNPPIKNVEKNVSNPKELFKSNNTYDLIDDIKNTSSETYNLSGGTFTFGNTSTTSTYSVISPEISKFRIPSFTEMEKVTNLNRMRTSSPVMLDNSNPNYLNFSGANAKAALSCITEEESFNKNISMLSNKGKRKSEIPETIFNISPPKRPFIKPKSPILQRKLNTTWNKKYEKTERIRKKSISSLRLNLTTSSNNKSITTTTKQTTTLCNIDPFLIAAMYTDSNSTTNPSDLDPFIASTLYYDEQWLDKQIKELKKWLNALLTPPLELDTSAESKKVDVAKIWQDCVKKKDLVYAPTKEKVSSTYHTNHNKLDHLRRKAIEMFHSHEVARVLSKVTVTLENKLLVIREDKNLHLDVGLQSQMMTLLLCYNPLWLRIGLETIYNERIPLDSNSDVIGLSTFIMLRFFHNPDLSKTNTVVHNKYLAGYAVRIKKFTLKKFLLLVYFLDYAKNHKLIAHDPCLFCRDAPIKESKELLIGFARELLSAVGDVTKFLRRLGYEVTHKQSYIDEFNYAVRNLGVDLRDGIRLTKAMEIILLRNDLTCQLRGPAISRLQKIHNVKVAMDSLKDANYVIAGEITPKDIVDGHREKTLSLLWQIIYRFQAPKFTQAAQTIQMWWQSLSIQIKRRILARPRQRRINAAIQIQQFYRNRKLMITERTKFLQMKQSTITIQRLFRCKQHRTEYLQQKRSVVIIQRTFRAYMRMKKQRTEFLVIKNAATIIQQYWRATLVANKIRTEYLMLQEVTIKIQRNFRAKQQIKQIRTNFLQQKFAAVTLQQYFRATILMRKERANYLLKRTSCIKIQQYFRSILMMKNEKQKYLKYKNAIVLIQDRFRAFIVKKKQREIYLKQRNAIICIQKYVRGWINMKIDRKQYLELKLAVVIVQHKYLANIAMRSVRKNYINTRNAALKVQQLFRANRLMKIERNMFVQQKLAAIKIQEKYRAYRAMKEARTNYLHQRNCIIKLQQRIKANRIMNKVRFDYLIAREAVIVIQQRFRANKAMESCRNYYWKLQQSAVVIQKRFKAKQAMDNYTKKRNAIIKLQQHFKAYLLMKHNRTDYLRKKAAVVCIQKRFRDYLQMKIEQNHYLTYKQHVTNIQHRFRANRQMKQVKGEYIRRKRAIIIIQNKWRATLLMRKQWYQFNILREAVICVQERFRANQTMKQTRNTYVIYRENVIYIQQKYRANKAMQKERHNYLMYKNAVILIQIQFRSNKAMEIIRTNYLLVRKAAIIIQQRFRAFRAMKLQHENFNKLKGASIIIQRNFKAYKLMKAQRNIYLNQYNLIIMLQQKIKAFIEMKKERQNYLELRKNTIVIQQRFKAMQLMKTCRTDYLTLRRAAIILQQHYRANVAMKMQRENYLKIRDSVLILQERFRANVAMKKTRGNYLLIKRSVIIIQEQYRLFKTMKLIREHYLRQKEATIIIQERYRATITMRNIRNEYLIKKEAAQLIQDKFRAYITMKEVRQNYLHQRQAVIIIQQRFRATITMRKIRNEYLRKKEAIQTIQDKLRAYLIMKKVQQNYLHQKRAVIIIQQRFRANQLMKQHRIMYLHQIESVIKIQRWFRNIKIGKKQYEMFKQLKQSVCLIQQRFREIKLMKKQQEKFLKMRKASIIIQTRFRSYLIMKTLRQQFLNMKISALKIQSYYRHYLLLKKDRIYFLQQKQIKLTAIIKIQSWYRMILAQKVLEQLKEDNIDTEEKRIERKMSQAAVKIQAIWRGYRTRSVEDSNITLIRQRTQDATRKALPEHTMGQRNIEAIELLIYQTSMKEIIRALTILDFTTRLFPNACIKVVDRIVDQLYLLLANTNRSVPDMEACGLCISVLINLFKFGATSKAVWRVDYIDTLLSLLLNWSDKEGVLFINLCTLIWLFAQQTENCKIILEAENASKRLLKTYQQCERKQKMLSRMKNTNNSTNTNICNKFPMKTANKPTTTRLSNVSFMRNNVAKVATDPIPSLVPDWGIVNKNRPRTFQNSLFAIKSLLKKLNMTVN